MNQTGSDHIVYFKEDGELKYRRWANPFSDQVMWSVLGRDTRINAPDWKSVDKDWQEALESHYQAMPTSHVIEVKANV